MSYRLLQNGDRRLLQDGTSYRLLQDGAAAPSAPSAPSGLSATAVSSSAIYIEWTDNSSDETSFTLQQSLDGSTGWTTVTTPAANATSDTDTGLDAETTYYYRIRASNAYGDSSWSSTANATTLAVSVSTESERVVSDPITDAIQQSINSPFGRGLM